jgi:glycerol uptake facilitator-like aquaporin
MKKYAAEFLGTFWPVIGGCGFACLLTIPLETRITPPGG